MRQIKELINRHAPPWIKSPLRRMRRTMQRWKRYTDRHVKGDIITNNQILNDLEALGVRKGDILLVHSSLSRLGYVEGGADTVVDSLLEGLGQNGTLLMPAFSFSKGMQEHLESEPHFDLLTSPSYMGKITEVFRQRPDVLRSLHPTHSMCAFGPKARYLTRGHENCRTPFGKSSPFAKLIELKGKIMCLGVPIAYITSFHTFEDWIDDYPLPVYLDKTYSVPVTDADGRNSTVSTRCHNPTYSAVRIEKRPALLELIENNFLEMGILNKSHIGKADASLIGAWELNEAMAKLLKRGITIYDVDLGEFESGRSPS